MKKLLMMVAGMVLALCAQADLLYFLVNSYSPEGPKYNFDYAMVGVAKNVDNQWVTTWGAGEEKVYLQVQVDGGGSADYVDSVPSGYYTEAGPSKALIADEYKADGYAFYIETYAGDGTDPIWGFDEATALGYTALLQQGHIYTDTTAAQDVTPWNIPEPTSGMLMLLGFASLCLRRKQHEVEV